MDNITVQTHTDMLVQRTAPVQERTMTMEQKQIKNKITARYNWSALGIGFQIIGAIITIVAAMGIIGCCLFLKGGDVVQKVACFLQAPGGVFFDGLAMRFPPFWVVGDYSDAVRPQGEPLQKLQPFIEGLGKRNPQQVPGCRSS